MESSSTVEKLVDNLDVSIESLEEALRPMLETSLDEKLSKCTNAEEKATLYHEYIYVINSILFAYLKVAGAKTEEHPIMKELARTKESINKLKHIKNQIESKNDADEASKKKTAEFLQRTLGTTGGVAAPDSLSSPAISSANFKGKHTKFDEK